MMMDSKKQQSFLTGQQVSLLKKSYRQLEPLRLAASFYEKLFMRYPHLKHLFPADRSDLMAKLMSVLELVVFSFEEKTSDQFFLQESMVLPLRDLGKKHDDYGVAPEHYTIANNLLIESIRERLGSLFSDEINESWSKSLHILSSAMQDSSVDSQLKNKVGGALFQSSFRQLFSKFKKRISHS